MITMLYRCTCKKLSSHVCAYHQIRHPSIQPPTHPTHTYTPWRNLRFCTCKVCSPTVVFVSYQPPHTPPHPHTHTLEKPFACTHMQKVFPTVCVCLPSNPTPPTPPTHTYTPCKQVFTVVSLLSMKV